MTRTKLLGEHGCGGDCRSCCCSHCGGELFSKLIRGRHKREHRRYQRRQDKSILRHVQSFYNWRTI